ncbi:MAG: DUF4276 family protein, partial [Polyangiaceae bacterium]|nr:DUF4276 family protein [Polyangiaceae bacterium]
QIKTLCASYDRVTMMFDYYGFPRDWRDTIDPSAPKAQRKSQLEAVVASRVDNVRFVPNLIMHEFEGLLFSQPSAIAKTVADSDQDESRWIAGLSLEARGFNSPEDINDSRESAPSKRILKVIPTYRKTLHGPLIAECIGLPVLRDKCHYFGHWIDLIEEICRKHSSRSGSNPADVCENDD